MPPRRARRTFKYKSTTKISRPPSKQKGPKWQHFTLPAARLSRHFRGSLLHCRSHCELGAGRVVDENELCVAIQDAYPVTPLHTLVIPKRHLADYFELYQSERNAIEAMLHQQRQAIMDADSSVTGFNVGINAGQSAGQTIFHVHVHLIPRRDGDVDDPRGGVRGVISTKQKY